VPSLQASFAPCVYMQETRKQANKQAKKEAKKIESMQKTY